MQRERQRPLQRQGAAPSQPAAKRELVEMLEHEMGPRPVERLAQAADDDRMRKPRQQARLPAQLPKRARVADLVRAHQLADDVA